MVSEAKKAVFGLQPAERPAENEIKAKSKINYMFDLVGALAVLYFYTVFYVIPRFVLLKALQIAQTLFASACATAYCARAKARFEDLKNTWSPKVQSLLDRATDYTLFIFAQKVYQKAVVPTVQNLVSIVRLLIEKAQLLLVRASLLVEWSFQVMSNVKQQVLETALVVRGLQVGKNIAQRTLAIYDTKLITLWSFVKQAILGKLGKRFKIVERLVEKKVEEEPRAAEKEKVEEAVEAVEAPVAEKKQEKEEVKPQEEEEEIVQPVARKLQFEEEPAAAKIAEKSVEEPATAVVEERKKEEEPLLQPAPTMVEEEHGEVPAEVSPRKKQEAHASEEHAHEEHLSPSKAKHGKKHKHTKKK